MTAESLIRTARSFLGHSEATRNSSPLIDHWLAGVAQPPGEPWCAAFACACIYQTEPRVGFLRSPSALKLITRNPDRVISDPEPGALVVWDHGHGKGHVAIITALLPDDHFSAIAGNTSADGHSREGTMVAEHTFSAKDGTIAGYLRVCKPLRPAP